MNNLRRFDEIISSIIKNKKLTLTAGYDSVYFKSFLYIKQYNYTFFKKHMYNYMFYFLCNLNKNKKLKFLSSQYLSIKRNKTKSIFTRFLSFLFRKGLKIQYLNNLNKGVSELFFFFFFFNKQLNNTYKGYKELIDLIPNFVNFYNFNTIIQFFITLLEPFFFLRIKRVEKKYRKHLKKKFIAQPVYIHPSKRTNLVLRSLIYYIQLFPNYKLSERISYSLFKILIEQKNSYLYRRKIYMYSKVFKRFQKKVF